MSRLETRFAELRAANRSALVTFITAGDPEVDATAPALHALVAGGADVLEVGMPFSDPEAEGPTIQRANERSLAAGTRLADVFGCVATFRTTDDSTPVVLMGYLNSILRIGPREFARLASEAGVDGVIIVNLPPEEASEIRAEFDQYGMDLIFLVTPTTTPERAKLIADACTGFVYFVSLKGVTGASHFAIEPIADQLAHLRSVTDLPVLVGFGIKQGSHAAAVVAHADGAVVGAAVVETMAALSGAARLDKLTEQCLELRSGLDA
ncbi:MAG: tryptophan synthase subunit alpha [Pseudomonadaceae bacterium]|nr:tryptophan synthase subunit alpha [Pseudomonadaceae bacterium]